MMRKSLLTLCFICLSIILLTPTGVIAGKPTTPTPPKLTLNPKNIVTAEPDGTGRLCVWGNTGPSSYTNIWTAQSVHYDSVAIGDADNDKTTREIVGTTWCKEGAGKNRWYNIFFDVYKEDWRPGGIWKSSPGVREDCVYYANEITIADVDGDSCNEVVMTTPHWLVVYEYDKATSQFYISASQPINGCGVESLTVKNLDGNSGDEILISVNPTYLTDPYPNQGYLYVYSYKPGQLTELANIYITDLRFGHQSLRVGDIDGNSDPEIITAAYTVTRTATGDVYQSYLVAWKWPTLSLLMKQGIGDPSTEWPWVHLDVGELDIGHGGDEVALAVAHGYTPDELNVYEWDGYVLSERWSINLNYYSVTINNVYIADSDADGFNEIIVGGAGQAEQTPGITCGFYLEVFNMDGNREWYRLEGTECEVWYAAVG